MTVRSFSFGGGMQSTAALVLAAQRKIDFDLFIFANVGEDSEKPATLQYVEEYAKPYAALHGIELVEVRRGGVNKSLMHKMERLESSLPIPVRYPSGAPARRSCTQDFKITAIDRELKARGATKDDPAIVGLGITMDEIERMRSEYDPRQPTQRRQYPLIDLRLYRQDCERIIREEGLPLPSKSACWFCPYTTLEEWRRMRRTEPDLFDKACGLEERLSTNRKKRGLTDVYLTDKGAAMELPLRILIGDDNQMALFEDDALSPACDGGYCMV